MPDTQEGQWEATSRQVSRMTDTLGKPIDAGVFDTVVALNLHGINTTGSCEGHLDHGIAAPWVDIGASGVRPMEKQVFLKMREFEQAHETDMPKDQRWSIREAAEEAKQEVKSLHYKERQKVVVFLDVFYQARFVPFDTRLTLNPFWIGGCRIESHGADYQEVLPLEEQRINLERYQEEMRAFTDFLKSRI